MSLSASAVRGGLADPVAGSQRIFRRVMDAFAEPGTIADLGGLVEPPSGIVPAAAAILAALADHDTPVWLESDDPKARDWLRFQTGAPTAEARADAQFALLAAGSVPDGWADFPLGTPDYPDRSATLVLPVAALDRGAALELVGPGIETVRKVAVDGLPAGFAAAMEANRARFPLGFDLVLVAGERALALPRTTRIREIR